MIRESAHVVIVGSGMGGGTLAWGLAQRGIDTLVVERGQVLPREPENWSPEAVFVEKRYKPDETWLERSAQLVECRVGRLVVLLAAEWIAREKPEARRALDELTEAVPPRRLVHTFVFPHLPDAPTLVEWDLVPTAKGTRVNVTHSRFEGETRTWKSVVSSWPKILDLYRCEIEAGDVPLGTKIQHGLMGALSFVLPRSLRTDVVEAHPPRVG